MKNRRNRTRRIDEPEPRGGAFGLSGGTPDGVGDRTDAASAEEGRLAAIVTDGAPVCVAFVDPDKRVLFLNRTGRIWLTASESLPTGTLLGDILGDDSDSPDVCFEQAMAGRPETCEKRFECKDGVERRLRIFFVPRFDRDGAVDGCVLSAVDITAELSSRVALRESEERYSQVFEISPEPILIHRAGVILAGNTAAAQFFGVESAGDLLGRSLLEFVPPCFRNGVNARIMAAQTERRRTSFSEARFTRADGKRVYLDFVDIPTTYEGEAAVLSIGRDITERKAADERLRLSEQKYREIFEYAVEGIFQTSPDGHFISANAATAHILGYGSPEELIRDVRDIGRQLYIEPERRRDYMALMREGCIVRGFEISLRHKDGRTIWVALHARPIYDDDGRLRYTEGILEDISDRKKAEQALRESEERYRELFDVSPEPMVVHKDGRIIFGNAAGVRFLGVSDAESLVGRDVISFVHPDQRTIVAERIRKAQDEAVRSEFIEVRFNRGDGTEGYLESIAVPLTYKGERAVLSLGRDITGRKRAEEALKSSEERFRTIFEIAPDCIYLKNADLRYTHVNPAVESLLGLPAEEIIGKRPEDLFGEDAGRYIRESDLRVLDGQTIEDEHTRPIRGVNLTFHDIRTPLRDSEGGIVGVCKFSRNITERKGVQPALRFVENEHRSKAMRTALEQARFAAGTDGIILLLGESGSGKDYLARWIHSKSQRADGPFFSINCAAVARELAESEFFGHERGAFTGAYGRKRGLLELAEGGTLLLNEIGELPLQLQSKLLTFLDTRSFTRVGGEKSIHVNARLIAATHRNLENEVSEGRFLEPLFYRLNVFTVRVPPLRERLDDIPHLVEQILSNLVAELRLTEVPYVAPEQIEKLRRYHWPGNVRELRNVLERAVMLSQGGGVDLPVPLLDRADEDWSHEIRFPRNEALSGILEEVIRTLCVEALRRSRGNKKRAAELLGISRHSLYRYMRNFGLFGEHE